MARKTALTLLNSTFVFVGNGLSPGNYSGDSLIEKGIVPTSWKVAGSVSTPLLAQISFQNGRHTITVEQNKVTIAQSVEFEDDFKKNEVHKNARRFLEKLKHISFTAVGTNFVVMMEMADASKFLKDAFVNQRVRRIEQLELDDISLTLAYKLKDGVLRIALASGESEVVLTGSRQKLKGIVATTNVHRDIDPNVPNAGVNAISKASEDWTRLQKALTTLIDT